MMRPATCILEGEAGRREILGRHEVEIAGFHRDFKRGVKETFMVASDGVTIRAQHRLSLGSHRLKYKPIMQKE